MRYEIRLSGSGGQGIITAGILLAKAAALNKGMNAVQSQSYGPEARGGASKAEVIISDEEINYPKVTHPDILVSLNQEAYDKYADNLKDTAVVIIDETMVKNYDPKKYKTYVMPIISTLSEQLGSAVSANIATVGALNEICKIVDNDGLLKTVISAFPPKAEANNVKAFNIGVELAKKALGSM